MNELQNGTVESNYAIEPVNEQNVYLLVKTKVQRLNIEHDNSLRLSK